jgi:hypothetical protein
MSAVVSNKDLNEIYAEFWRRTVAETARRMADPVIRTLAMEQIRREHLRGLPVYHQMSLDGALERVEQIGKAFAAEHKALAIRDLGRKGGRAKKKDGLQLRIEEIVFRRPEITRSDLFDCLRGETTPGGLIEEIADDSIWFRQVDRLKEAAISGLKHRLTRARKAVALKKI